MNINYRKLLMLLALFATVFLQSCSDDDPAPVKTGADGFFIVHEGTFGAENSSISFYDRETDQVTNDVFATVNDRTLGDQSQSMTVFEGKGYILVQAEGKIEVIDADDYASITTIDDDIESPRYMLAVSSTKAYVSDWGTDGKTGTVKVIDLTTNTVTKTIATGKGSNKMLKVNNLVYVTNSGGYGSDNSVKVVDTNTDAVTATITVGDNPNSIQRDAAGNIWVTSSGKTVYAPYPTIDEENSTKASISKIVGNEEVLRMEIGDLGDGAGSLEISPDGRTLYFLSNGNVYSMGSTATTPPTTPLLANKFYYGFSVDPFNGNLIGANAGDFVSAGSIDVLKADGTLIKSHTVGIAPNGIAFK